MVLQGRVGYNWCISFRGRGGVLPFANGELGAEPVKVPCSNEGGEGRAVWVFECDD